MPAGRPGGGVQLHFLLVPGPGMGGGPRVSWCPERGCVLNLAGPCHSAARPPAAAGEVLHPQQQRHAGLEDAALHPQPRGRLHPGAGRRGRGAVPGEPCLLLSGVQTRRPQCLPMPRRPGQPKRLLSALMPPERVLAPRTESWGCKGPEAGIGFLCSKKRKEARGARGSRERMGLVHQGLGQGGPSRWRWWLQGKPEVTFL